MIRIIGVTQEHDIVQNIQLEEIESGDYLWYWVDFNQPTEEESKLLSTFFIFIH